MPRPGPRVQEKSKNFKGSITRLIGNLKSWKYFMILALVLAMISSILSLVAPNKLSDLTDTITAGISLKEEKLEEIGTKIGDNFSEEKLQNKMKSLYINVELTKEELSDVNKIFEQLKDAEEKEQLLLQLPDKVLIYRGADNPEYEYGFSWTLDKNIAIWFANRHEDRKPYVYECTVDKRDLICYFEIRNEKEVIVDLEALRKYEIR